MSQGASAVDDPPSFCRRSRSVALLAKASHSGGKMNLTTAIGKTLTDMFRHSYSILLIVLICVGSASAQFTYTNTDGATPTGTTPGTPEGSYELSGFDNINPYNGNLNFHLPLVQLSGR